MNDLTKQITANAGSRQAAMSTWSRGLPVGVSEREPYRSWCIDGARKLSVARAARRVLDAHVPGAGREEDFAHAPPPRDERFPIADAELSGSQACRAENEPMKSPRRNSIG
jgi:hypothetical protein